MYIREVNNLPKTRRGMVENPIPFFVVGRLYESQDCILSLSNKYLIYIKVKDIFRYTNLYQEYLNKISAQLHRLSQKQKLNKI